MNALMMKFKDVFFAVFPVVVLVVILNFIVAPLETVLLIRFFIGALLLIAGLSFLLHGVDLTFLPLGDNMGDALLKSDKLGLVVIISFVLGFFVVFAEPSVQALAEQVAEAAGNIVSTVLIRIVVAAGAGVLMALGMMRILKNFSIRILMSIILAGALVLSFFAPDMLAIAFDSVGAATGAITVPFILALAKGASAMNKDSKTAEEDSFGLVGTTALGAVFGVLILSLFISAGDTVESSAALTGSGSVFDPFFAEIPAVALDSMLTLLPIILMLLIFQKFKFKLHKRAFLKMLVGFLYAYTGLFLFFVGVNAGFLNVGKTIGGSLAEFGSDALIIIVGFVLGMLIVLTEPAVYVFTHQIEDITNGHIKRKTVLIFLAIGVSFSVGLSMLRIIVPGIMLWHYLLPGFAAAAVLMFITPKLFVGIGFDSGAVAAGPMTATFVLAFARGISDATEHADPLTDAFGIIAMVTIMPVIALQLLGFIYKLKLQKRRGEKKNDI
ncbi:MAG: DUF1538 domain-containing protein [Oscillospiraceae bacterium]|nr:DUF1538 domain-containing protein [Oscillospiraceae bacterium]